MTLNVFNKTDTVPITNKTTNKKYYYNEIMQCELQKQET